MVAGSGEVERLPATVVLAARQGLGEAGQAAVGGHVSPVDVGIQRRGTLHKQQPCFMIESLLSV